MIKVGITGGIGSGKSFICTIFESFGIPIYNSDIRAKKLMLSPPVSDQVKTLLGEKSYSDGKLNKIYIGEKIFADKKLLSGLNDIVHPAVAEDYKKWLIEHKESIYTIKESALIFETDLHQSLDRTITVYSPRDLRIRRIKQRDKSSRDKIKQKMKNQSSDYLKLKLSNYIVFNDEEIALLPQIVKIHKSLTSNK